jgi:hypothetical protein
MKRAQRDKIQQIAKLAAATKPRGRGRPPSAEEVARRKLAGLPNRSIQAVVTQAINAYLGDK